MRRVWKQWTDEHRITRKTDSERRKVKSAHDDRNLLLMVVNDRAAFSRQLAASFPRAIFQQDNARSYVAKTVRDFCSAQHVQFFPWSAYSLDMPPIKHLWDLVGHHLARDPRPAS
ncbi:hypothetical protein TNCV_4763041 [Trichonephila clavipes]|nr:hypothetical protein TNCV_4763041 [Trichonephila clavipes]